MAQAGQSAPIDDTTLGSEINALPNGDSGSTANSAYPPSEKQIELIANLMDQKGYLKEDLIEAGFVPDELTGGREGTASELIEYLMKAPSKKDVNGNPYPVEEELPTINVEDEPENGIKDPEMKAEYERISSLSEKL